MSMTGDIALSRQLALETMLEVITENMALQGAIGAEEQHVIFTEFLGKENPGGKPSYTNDVTTYREMRLGNIMETGNPYHIARQSQGYFGVQTPEGPRYTGNGAFTRSAEGVLVDQFGNPVLSMDGGEIVIPAEAQYIRIGSDGTIVDDQGVVGRMGLFTFENPYNLIQDGDTMMRTDQVAIPMEADAVMQQGALNNSNGNPIKNTTKLIDVTKQYAMNQKIIDGELGRKSKATDMLVTLAPAV